MILLVFLLFVDPTLQLNGKSLNIELETSILLEPSDLEGPKALLKNAQNFFNFLRNGMKFRTDETAEDQNNVLTKFIDDLGVVLINFDDDLLKDFVRTVYLETQSQYNVVPKTSVFVKPKLKKIIMNRLQDIALARPNILRHDIKTFLQNYKNNRIFLDTLNQFYDAEDAKVLDNFIEKVQSHSRRQNSRVELEDTVRDALDFIVLKRYDRLSNTSKEKLTKELNKKFEIDEPDKKIDLDVLLSFKRNIDHNFRRDNDLIFMPNIDNTTIPIETSNGTIDVNDHSNNIIETSTHRVNETDFKITNASNTTTSYVEFYKK